MKIRIASVLVIVLFTSLISSLLTANVIGQSVFNKSRNRAVAVFDGNDGVCSGVILKTDLVLTCAHCIRNKKTVKVGGKEALVLKIDTDKDLALLSVGTIYVEPILVATLTIGDDIFKFGFPYDSPKVVYTRGNVMVVQMGSVFSTLFIMPGDSGAGVFDMNGNLVGIARATAPDKRVAITVSPEDIKEFLK